MRRAIAALVARVQRAATQANAVRPTFAGVWYLLVLAGVTFGAVNTGNNLVYVVLAALLAVLVVNNLLAEWNLRALRVARVLPTECFAGAPSYGAFTLVNARSRGAAWGIEVAEVGEGGASAVFDSVAAGDSGESGAVWTFSTRGTVRLGRIRVGSRFPFGLLRRYRDHVAEADLLVYPRPINGELEAAATATGDGEDPATSRQGAGDLVGLRPYLPGDAVRRIHWRTTARTGTPMVTQRAGEAGGEVLLRVDPGQGEQGIERACGAVLHHARRGDAVGIELPDGTRIAPRTGATQRRRLLTALALLPAPVASGRAPA
jgi:uncharacterized protein (DUF58 family)